MPTLTVKAKRCINSNGFNVTNFKAKFTIEVSEGVLSDPDSREWYTLQDDDWLRDWAGNEIELGSRSLAELKGALGL